MGWPGWCALPTSTGCEVAVRRAGDTDYPNKKAFPGNGKAFYGADYWTRTNDLLITNELLYQLS